MLFQQLLTKLLILSMVVIERITFPGPAYTNLPGAPCALYQLVPLAERKLELPVTDLPKQCVFVSFGALLHPPEMLKLGFTTRQYQGTFNKGSAAPLTEGDLRREEHRNELINAFQNDSIYLCHIEPGDKTWITRGGPEGTRSLARPVGTADDNDSLQKLSDETQANAIMASSLWMFYYACVNGITAVFVHGRFL